MTRTCIGADVSKAWIDLFDPVCGRSGAAVERKALRVFARSLALGTRS